MVVVFYSPFAVLWALNWGWDLGFGRLIVEGKDSSRSNRFLDWPCFSSYGIVVDDIKD